MLFGNQYTYVLVINIQNVVGRNQNKQTFGPIKRDSYVVYANRDKISRYTDIERKTK